jgi:hypothetical protein
MRKRAMSGSVVVGVLLWGFVFPWTACSTEKQKGKAGTGGTANGNSDGTNDCALAPDGNDDGGASVTDGALTAGGTSAAECAIAAGAASMADDANTVDCTITATATASAAIPTVFAVAFTTDLPDVDSAHVDFGLDTSYEYTAPVELGDAVTLLLGMKPSRLYHYRVVVSSGGVTCYGHDRIFTTHALAAGLPEARVTTNDGSALAGGFLLSEFYTGKPGAFIVDKDADIVWWFDPKTVNPDFGDVTRARMSTDGKSMWIAHGNVPQGTAHMLRIGMDGWDPEDLSSTFTDLNHDFTIVNDASGDWIYFIAYGESPALCDDIREYSPTGTVRTVMNMGTAFSSGACHTNAIEYSKEDDTLVVSDLSHDAYVKIERGTGKIVWVLGGGRDNGFTGDAASWTNQHNCDVLGANHLLMFNNGTDSGSAAIELELDTQAMTATKLWEYWASPAVSDAFMGDVQRLPNGNTIVAYSAQGVVHEVSADMDLLQSINWGIKAEIGYVIKRPTLYGPSPK